MTTQQTPTPWRIEQKNTPIMGNQIYIFGQKTDDALPHSGAFITAIPESRKANADFIVKACNSHDELLELVKRAYTYMTCEHDDLAGQMFIEDLANAIEKAGQL